MLVAVKRPVHKGLIFIHKWLGVGLALLFLMWFVSGVVLYFVPFPGLSQAERLAGLPPLELPKSCCMTAEQASTKAGLATTEARLGMHEGQPVWRVLAKPANDTKAAAQWRAVAAQTGQLQPALSVAAASKVAEAFSGQRALRTELLERDQWTVPQGLNPYRPLVKVELDSPDGLVLYVSPNSAEVVRDTRRAERFWNWLGAVPHWIYFTELRRYPDAWHNVVVWLSIPSVILAVTGTILGAWHLFLNRARWIPYRQWWMRWHHISGLVAAIFTLTWMFSGLLSMNPFGVFSPRAAQPEETVQWVGKKVDALVTPDAALEITRDFSVKEMDMLRVTGQSWYRLRGSDTQHLVRADSTTANQQLQPVGQLPDETVKASLLLLRPAAAGSVTLSKMTAYDDMYYARTVTTNTRHTRPLPVWRAKWADGTSLYADPASGKLLLRIDESNRWQRLLYAGLHSFDFAPLLARPLLRDALIVVLSVLGTALCVTSCVIAWRVLKPKKRKAVRTARS